MRKKNKKNNKPVAYLQSDGYYKLNYSFTWNNEVLNKLKADFDCITTLDGYVFTRKAIDYLINERNIKIKITN